MVTINSQTDIKQLNIKRTICIGLGGTGRDILMQIRRLIIDRYGKLSNLPIISFVHIDTDINESRKTGLKSGDDYHGEKIKFKPAEIVEATMKAQEVDDLTRGLERRSQYERQSPFDHIANWFPPQALKDVKSIEYGAGAVRPIGRLAFFHNPNFNKIQNAIKTAENLTREKDPDKKLLGKNIFVEPGINIIIVGSLCGGTGSGMFLDIAYTLRKMYGYEISNEITAYLVIAPELYGDTPSVKANTYAALKELNYYTGQGTNFRANYDPVNLFSVDESRPPFDFVYLVGNKANSGHKIIKKDQLSLVIAHKIFADIAEEISTNIKAHRDNVKKYFSVLDEHPRPNPQRYLTFGLAKIYLPRDLTVTISLNKVKLQLINFWLYGEGQNLDSGDLLANFLLNWQSKMEDTNIFQAKLEGITLENEKTFQQTIKTWQSQILADIENCKNSDQRQRFIEQTGSKIKSQFKKVQPGETENIRGIWLTNLAKNSIKLQKDFTQDIVNFLEQLLKPINRNFALDTARGWLEALFTKLNEYTRELETEKEKSINLVTQDDIDKKWRDSCQIFQDIETEKTGFFPMSQKTRNSKFQSEATESLQEIVKLIKRNFQLTLIEETLKIVNNLTQEVQKFKTKTTDFYYLLQNLEKSYGKNNQELSQFDYDELNGEAIFDVGDNENLSQLLLTEQNSANLLANITNNLTNSSSLLYFFNSDRLIEEEELSSRINQNIEDKFSNNSFELAESVVNRFIQKYPFSDGIDRLKQIINKADVLLPLNTSDRYFVNDPDKTKQMIGFKQVDDRGNQEFNNIINQIGINSSIIVPLQNQNEVIIIKEFAGFPLRIVNGLRELKAQYERQKSLYDGYLLHNDYATFFLDIIPPDARDMEQLQDLFYTCLAFGKITKNTQEKNYQITCEDKLRNSTYLVELSGIWAEALEEISLNNDIKDFLENSRINLISEIQQQPNLFEQVYYPQFIKFIDELDKLTEYEANFSEKKIVLGERTSRSKLGTEGILGRIFEEFRTIVENAKKSNNSDPNKILSSSNSINNNKALLTAQNLNNSSTIEDAEIIDSDSDFWENEQPIANKNIDLNFYEKWKNVTPLQLLEMKKEGILTDEDIQKIKKVLGL